MIENLGHCKKDLINIFFSKLVPNELKDYREMGFIMGINFFYNKLKRNNFFKQMLINVFFKNALESFIEDRIFIIKKQNIMKSKKISF